MSDRIDEAIELYDKGEITRGEFRSLLYKELGMKDEDNHIVIGSDCSDKNEVVDALFEWPEFCPTCDEPYYVPPTFRAMICSNGFHCCRDCIWKDGKVIKDCGQHVLTPFHLPQDSTDGLNALYGKWPGNETDEEVFEALKKKVMSMSQKKKKIRQLFRDSVFERDEYKCRKCGNAGILDAHHITNREAMPNGGYVRENGITLRPDCHVKAEQFYDTGVAIEGFAPDDLYKLVGSSYESAHKTSAELGD
jgi:hypothetical protein